MPARIQKSALFPISLFVPGALLVVTGLLASVLLTFGRPSLVRFLLTHHSLFNYFGSLSAIEAAFTRAIPITLLVVAMGVLHAIVGVGLVLAVSRPGASVDRVPASEIEASPAGASKVSLGELFVLLGVTALGLGLRLQGMTRNFEYDELFSVWHFIDTPSFWETMSRYYTFNNHIGYSVLARAAMLGCGRDEWVFRVPALCCGVAAIPSLWLIGRRWFGPTVAAVAALLMALSPFHIAYSRTARGYTALTLLALLATSAFCRSLDNHPRQHRLGLILASVTAIYAHLYGLWILVVHVIYLMIVAITTWFRRSTCTLTPGRLVTLWNECAVVGAAVALLYAPAAGQFLAFVVSKRRRALDPWFAWHAALELGSLSDISSIVSACILVLVGTFIWKGREAPSIVLALGLIGIPVLLISVARRPSALSTRYFIYWIPYLMLLLALGASYYPRDAKRAWVRHSCRVVLLALLGLVGADWAGSWRASADSPGYREGMAALRNQLGPSASICSFGADADLLEYYSRRRFQRVSSVEDWNTLVSKAHIDGCVSHNMPWNSQAEADLAAVLRKQGRTMAYGPVTVYLLTVGQSATGLQ